LKKLKGFAGKPKRMKAKKKGGKAKGEKREILWNVGQS